VSAQELRDAAAAMRERAQAATASEWFPIQAPGRTVSDDGDWIVDSVPAFVCSTHIWDERGKADAEHIAAWHPAVALAVADWLESTANDVEHVHDPIYNLTSTTVARALKAARAYLGSAS
jgi:hypothetical protein